jgi:hypothetical protein
MITNPRPLYTAAQAVMHARAAVGHFTYQLGTGDLDTPIEGKTDCVFALVHCYGIKRHRPGFNRNIPGRRRTLMGPDGNAPSIVDDINCNSQIEDANYAQDLMRELDDHELPAPGDILAWPSITLRHADGTKYFDGTGHNGIVVDVTRALAKWNPRAPDFATLDVVQCCGPNDHHPGVVLSDGVAWRVHSSQWPKPEHRSRILRVVP